MGTYLEEVALELNPAGMCSSPQKPPVQGHLAFLWDWEEGLEWEDVGMQNASNTRPGATSPVRPGPQGRVPDRSACLEYYLGAGKGAGPEGED